MATGIRKIIDFLSPARLREVCEHSGLQVRGGQQEQKERLVSALGGDLGELLPLLTRADLVEFAAQYVEGVGRFANVSRASRDDLERLVARLCAGDQRITTKHPLGPESPIQFVRAGAGDDGTRDEEASADERVFEKVKRTGLKRESGYMYYVKDGDVWALPRPRRGVPKAKPRCVCQVGLKVDHATYLYFVDADGDIARKRRDGTPLPVIRDSINDSVDPGRPIRVFIAYSRRDRSFLEQFCAALAPYEQSGQLQVFVDSRIVPGQIWEAELQEQLAQARIVVMLLSNDFLNSRYCMDEEVPRALARHRRGECQIMPVLIRACRYDKSTLAELQAVQPDDRAVDEHDRKDSAWKAVTVRLDEVIDQIESAALPKPRARGR
jgi:hypothetical protein